MEYQIGFVNVDGYGHLGETDSLVDAFIQACWRTGCARANGDRWCYRYTVYDNASVFYLGLSRPVLYKRLNADHLRMLYENGVITFADYETRYNALNL